MYYFNDRLNVFSSIVNQVQEHDEIIINVSIRYRLLYRGQTSNRVYSSAGANSERIIQLDLIRRTKVC